MFMRKHKRIKYNWLYIINELDMVRAFDEFKAENDLKQHLKGKKSLSVNRLYRAFVLHYRRLLPLDLSWAIKGKEVHVDDYFYESCVYESDIGSDTVREMKIQNGEF